MSLTHVSGAIASVQTFIFTFTFIGCIRVLVQNQYNLWAVAYLFWNFRSTIDMVLLTNKQTNATKNRYLASGWWGEVNNNERVMKLSK